MDPTISFILQALLGVVMLFFGFILNGMRLDMKSDRDATVSALKEIRDDLKSLNSAVLGKYALTEDIVRWRASHILEEAKWKESHMIEAGRAADEQRKFTNQLHDDIHLINVTLAKMQAKRYGDEAK